MKLIEFLKTYIKGVGEEARRISWPTRKEATKDVIALIIFCLIVALFLGIVDYVFLQGVGIFIKK